jgi:hypothetical protein
VAGVSSREGAGFYWPRGIRSMVLWEWKRLGTAGGAPRRRCALVLGVRSMVEMAGWFGLNGHGFRT